MNKLRLLLAVMLAGSTLALTGCEKKSVPSTPQTEHPADDDHAGHNH